MRELDAAGLSVPVCDAVSVGVGSGESDAVPLPVRVRAAVRVPDGVAV